MTDPKPVKMWALTRPGDEAFSAWKIRDTSAEAIELAEYMTETSWPILQEEGYRCIPVTITPDPESEK